MGLDQYAFRCITSVPDGFKEEDSGFYVNPADPSNFVFIGDEETPLAGKTMEQISQWRKHPSLEGFMEQEWKALGNTDEFNCEHLPVTTEMLDKLEKLVVAGDLPETVGFFFGDDHSEEYRDQDLKFIRDAREALANEQEVYYSSWW